MCIPNESNVVQVTSTRSEFLSVPVLFLVKLLKVLLSIRETSETEEDLLLEKRKPSRATEALEEVAWNEESDKDASWECGGLLLLGHSDAPSRDVPPGPAPPKTASTLRASSASIVSIWKCDEVSPSLLRNVSLVGVASLAPEPASTRLAVPHCRRVRPESEIHLSRLDSSPRAPRVSSVGDGDRRATSHLRTTVKKRGQGETHREAEAPPLRPLRVSG
uniref:Uncharacterized protein n=1 Tax=Steinernema glaseri TaxID=37863 RepID=A0A1I7ZP30_9BILA